MNDSPFETVPGGLPRVQLSDAVRGVIDGIWMSCDQESRETVARDLGAVKMLEMMRERLLLNVMHMRLGKMPMTDRVVIAAQFYDETNDPVTRKIAEEYLAGLMGMA